MTSAARAAGWWVGLAWLAGLPAAIGQQTEAAKAYVTGAHGIPDQCLAPVHVLEIDGQEALVDQAGFTLPAGWHRLNGRAELDLTYCRPAGLAAGGPVPDLEAEFVAGTAYHIGLDHRSPDVGDWRLVIWKVEPMEALAAPGAERPE